MSEEKIPDWSAIEINYRLGIKALRQIATEQGLTEGAIRKRAKKGDWEHAPKPARSVVLTQQADEFDRSGFVYVVFIDAAGERLFKIGMASHFDSRLKSHQCPSPFDICVACAYFVPDMRHEERALHEQFADKRIRGEWFRLTSEDVRALAARAALV
jgi:hypothetical protein